MELISNIVDQFTFENEISDDNSVPTCTGQLKVCDRHIVFVVILVSGSKRNF